MTKKFSLKPLHRFLINDVKNEIQNPDFFLLLTI